jgi:D-2-hydroxyacid dehydrogenase (NADP+)
VTKILLVDHEFEKYQSYLEPKYPEVDFTFAENGDGVEPLLAVTEGLISFARWLTADMTAATPELKWLQCMIAGTEHLNQPLAGRPDILLTNGRGIHGPQMAEMALFHMLALYRQVRRLAGNQASHVYERFLPKVLDTRKVAILGLGAIAEHMAKVFSSLGMTVYGISRTPRAVEGIDKVFTRDNMAEAVADVDFLVVLLPLGPDTEKIVGRETFAAMKPSACLINVARGGVVDEAALIEALQSGAIAGAGLDVYETDPLPEESPLWDLENVFMTPFIGGRSDLYAERILTVIEPNLRLYLDGDLDKMVNIVDRT